MSRLLLPTELMVQIDYINIISYKIQNVNKKIVDTEISTKRLHLHESNVKLRHHVDGVMSSLYMFNVDHI